MATLPTSAAVTGGSTTEGQTKTWLSSVRDFLADLLGTDSSNKSAAMAALGVVLNGSLAKSGAYTLVAADRGKVVNATGTWTLSLTAAATLGDGFAFAVLNGGTGTITVDPNGSEQIDGATTKDVSAGKLCVIYCDGSAFYSIYDDLALGVSQTWQNMTSSRALGAGYTNSTGRPICVQVYFASISGNVTLTPAVGGVALAASVSSAAALVDFIVPSGATYSVSASGSGVNLYWVELR